MKKYLALAVLGLFGLLLGSGQVHFSSAAAAPTVFMSPSGSGTACTQAAPCSSVPNAYAKAAASGGATVEMAGGSYSQVQFSGNQGSSSGMVVFQPAAGASVSWGEFRPYGADNIEIDNVTMEAYLNGTNGYTGSPASNLVFRNDKITGADLYIRNADHVQFLGGEVCCDNTGIPTPTVGNGGVGTGYTRVNNILFDGVRFHDISRQQNPTEHDECLFVQGASYVTVQNSTFVNCSIMDIYLHGISGEANPDHVKLLNNNFGQMGPLSIDQGFYTVLFRADAGEAINGFDVENNYFAQPLYLENDPAASVSGLVACGNTGVPFSSPLSPVTWASCTPGTTSSTTTTVPTTSTTVPSTTSTTVPSTTSTTTPTVTVTTTLPQDTTTIFSTTTLPAVTTTVSDCTPDVPYANCSDEIAGLKQQISDLNGQVNALQAELVLANDQIVSLQSQLDQANADKASLQSQLDQALIDKDNLQHMLDAANNTITQVKAWLAQAPALP